MVLDKSVKLINKDSILIDDSVKIGNNVTIYPNNIIKGNTTIKDNVLLMSNNYIEDSTIETCAIVNHSYIEHSIVGGGSHIGPYSHLRPNSVVGNNCKIGNFVEIKNSTLGNRTKASHLAYIGDADVGDDCNIGCGAVFVNYNGKEKHRSKVGNNCFIGSNVNVIAPITIADNSYVCAGTTITVDTSPKDFVIGRARETIKHNYADKYSKEVR